MSAQSFKLYLFASSNLYNCLLSICKHKSFLFGETNVAGRFPTSYVCGRRDNDDNKFVYNSYKFCVVNNKYHFKLSLKCNLRQ